jgi:hypothetical protein
MIYLAHYRLQWQGFVKTAMKLNAYVKSSEYLD